MSLYAVYNRRCGHVLGVHGDRAMQERIVEGLQPANGWALRTRKATDEDVVALMQGVRCGTCSLDGQQVEPTPAPKLT